MERFRERLLDAKPRVCGERALAATDTYRLNADQPLVLRHALMYKHALETMSIFIEPETLLAGNHASENRNALVFPEYGMDWLAADLGEFEKPGGERLYISPETKSSLREIASFWEHTLKDQEGTAVPVSTIPVSAKVFYDRGIIDQGIIDRNITDRKIINRKIIEQGIIQAEESGSAGDVYIAPDYQSLLTKGLKDYQRRAQEKLNALNPANHRDAAKSYFYRAVIIGIDAAVTFARRYAMLAHRMAVAEPDLNRKCELEEMSRILNKVPYEPAETFYEAVQSLWLTHLCLHIESNAYSFSYGRMDQYLYPFYEQDVSAGRIRGGQACELLANLWLKTFSINEISGGPLFHTVTIGGQVLDAEGQARNAVNPLSLLILRTAALTKLPQPRLTVRYHPGLDDAFMDACIEAVRLGFGMPGFASDEIIIPGLISKGVAREDAYDYCIAGRLEPAVPGKGICRCTGMSFLNFPKALLVALNNGADPQTGTALCQGAGHFRDMQSYEDVMQAWTQIIQQFTQQCLIIDSAPSAVMKPDSAEALGSALSGDCLELGLSLREGGGVYDCIASGYEGIAALGDSLGAIKKCVFEDKSVSPGELWNALEKNFEGPKNERIRRLLLTAPKYGSSDDYADTLARQAYAIYLNTLKKYYNIRQNRALIGGGYAGTSFLYAVVPQNPGTATPDGRKAGEPPFAETAPVQSSARKRFAGIFKPRAKLPVQEITSAALFTRRLSPQMLEKPENRRRLISLMRHFFSRLPGFCLQL
jgi:formate C-acetyltransferase